MQVICRVGKLVWQSSGNISEFPLYPDYDLNREQSLAERAVTLVTNNLSVANLWVLIPLILLGETDHGEKEFILMTPIIVISIFLFAVVFAPSSLFRQAFSMMGLFDGGGAQSKDAKSELESSEIQNNTIDQEDPVDETDDDIVFDKDEASVGLETSLKSLWFTVRFQSFFDSFPNFFSMVSDIRPAVETMSVPDILLSRNESLVTEMEAMTSTLESAATTVMPLQELYDASSLLRSFQ